MTAKGKAAPIEVWEPLDARSRVEIEAFESASPLVGRQRELDVLLDAFGRARSEDEPQLVTLVGVPGIGKSRLVYEFYRHGVELDPDLIYWRQGRCLPYGEGVTFAAVADVVKAQAGVLETDSTEDVAAKLAGAVESAVGDESGWVLPHVRPLAGLGGDGAEIAQDHQSEAFAAWRRFFEGLADERPLVLVFEDLHWGDEGLLDFLDHLVEWATGVPLLVLCTARPELLDRRAGWGGGKLNATMLRVPALADDDAARLVAQLIGDALLPAETQAALLTRAGGNPLYAEQYARMLAERGSVEDLPLPENVQGLIAARLDLLSTEEKGLLQDAAVIGRTFWPAALRAIAASVESIDDALHALERKEFIRRERRSTFGGEAEYVFRHVLVRDVGYGQMPRLERAQKHRRAAEWYEALGRPEDHAEMLAHHYASALEYARAAGLPEDDLVVRARVALREAGDRATSLGAFDAAARFYGRALELSSDGDERAQLLFHQGRAQYRAVGEGARAPLEEALEALYLSDAESAAEAESILAELDFQEGHHDLAVERHRRATRLVADAPPSRSKASVLANYARFLMTASDEEAVPVGREALEIANAVGARDLTSMALNVVGTARANAGEAAGIAEIERALELALDADAPSEILRGYNNLASTVANYGDLRRCFELHGRAREAAKRFGYLMRIRWFKGERVVEDYQSGRWDDALQGAGDLIEAGGMPYLQPMSLALRGTILIARGEVEPGLDDTARSLELARGIKDPQMLFPVMGYHADGLVVGGRPDEAGRVANELLRLWEDSTSTFPPADWVAPLAAALTSLGEVNGLAATASKAGARTRWVDAALALARGDFVAAADTYADIGSLPAEANARLRAGTEPQVRRALDFYRSVGAARYIREGEALLAATA